MLVNLVKVRVRAEQRQRFLEAIEVDCTGSNQEPGCARFDVLQDANDPDVYYFYEAYEDQAAIDHHRSTPHYATWRAVVPDAIDGPIEITQTTAVFPANDFGRGKR
jgi:autoinducer 2-degrading protein